MSHPVSGRYLLLHAGAKAAAEAAIAQLTASHRFSAPIVTQVVAATDFWKAEEYHQHYLDKTVSAVAGFSNGAAIHFTCYLRCGI